MDSVIDFLDGKKVFVFDTETTGLPNKVPGGGWNSYYPYYMIDKYKTSRIVSIAWGYTDNFSKNTIANVSVDHYIRYPEGFNEIPTTHIHGITFQETLEKGIPFCDILNTYGLANILLNCDYIVAHNVSFDINILLSELSRLETDIARECIIKLVSMKDNGKCICSGEITTDICKLKMKNNYVNNSNTNSSKKIKKYKMPKLSELYQYCYDNMFDGAHSADGDVRALLKILAKI
jgi:DNA polymerase III epsilon subunit-like protein